jgi:hypothetical protein
VCEELLQVAGVVVGKVGMNLGGVFVLGIESFIECVDLLFDDTVQVVLCWYLGT